MASRLQEESDLDNMLHLICHPDTPAKFVQEIFCFAELQNNNSLWIRYHIEAPLNDLKLAGPKEPERANGLWKTTCFEAFLSVDNAPEYYELNFSSSSQWAAYHFSDYRNGMRNLDVSKAPEIGLDMGEDYFALEANVRLPAPLHADTLKLNIAVVVEESNGIKSYWALAHAAGPPDFHHRDCFTEKLKARSGL
jgi:hypothetical protein